MNLSFLPATLAACALASLSACGGGGTASNSTNTLSGTAATGAPITNATVSVQCQSGTAQNTSTHASNGSWQITLGTGVQLPCALQVSGGSLPAGTQYHSIAMDIGTANITPWTDLVLANAAEQDPSTWYASAQLATHLQTLSQTALNTALARVNTQLGVNGTLVDNRNPLTSSFQADGSDKLDKVLDAIKAAMGSAGTTHANLLAEAIKGGNFTAPSTFASALSTQLTNLSSNSVCTSPSVLLSYSGNAGGPVSHGASLCFGTISTSTLAFGSTTLSTPSQNTLVSAPYSAYVFTDNANALKYEVVFHNNTLHEINLSTASGSFLGQFSATGSSSNAATGVTLPDGSTIAASVEATYLPLINGAGNKIINYLDSSSNARVEVYDYVNTITVSAARSGFSAHVSCALNALGTSASSPLCASLGIEFERSAGSIRLTNVTMTPLVQLSYSCTKTGSCRINGSLAFTAYP